MFVLASAIGSVSRYLRCGGVRAEETEWSRGMLRWKPPVADVTGKASAEPWSYDIIVCVSSGSTGPVGDTGLPGVQGLPGEFRSGLFT